MRWHRIALPMGVATLLLLVTAVAYAIEEPDRTDREFLSPTSTAPIGARQLAETLREQGVRVQHMTRTADALLAANHGDATLFVPVPHVVRPDYLRMLRSLPATTRVVLVDPPERSLDHAEIPITTGARRWAARAVPPETGDQPCTVDDVRTAGVAAALRQRYRANADRCYGGGVVALDWHSTEVVVVGAVDPFRNDRIGEHGNRALAVALLGAYPRVIWLDLHDLEPPPDEVDLPGETSDATPGSPAPDGEDAGPEGSGAPTESATDPEPADGTGSSDASQSRTTDSNPLWDAFPGWFWALLVQLAVAALMAALWRARRLGAPVTEPLPVTVRAAETVVGRGRLYRRARARGPAADILRAAARERIAEPLGLPQDESLVDALAARTGRDRAEIDALLYGAAPDTDEELRRLHAELEALVDGVRRTR